MLSKEVKVRASLCVQISNVDFISQIEGIWLSGKILIKIHTFSTYSDIVNLDIRTYRIAAESLIIMSPNFM